MKVYYSCGLKELAKCSGFRAETLTSLEKCSNFKRTHLFLMQVWEALYREIFEAFCKNRQGTVLPLFDVVLSEVHKHLQTTASLSQLQSHIHTKLAATVVERELYEFVEKLSSTDDTRRFWKQFVFEDCYAYALSFYSYPNWKLEVKSVKPEANGIPVCSIRPAIIPKDHSPTLGRYSHLP